MALNMNLRRRTRSLAVVAAAALAATSLAACGVTGESEADLANGKQKFQASCGSCHALADAGAKGTIGPNLDDAFRGPRAEGYPENSFSNVVEYSIKHPDKLSDPEMPANLVTGQDAIDVAWYVAKMAGAGDAAEESTVRPATERPMPKLRSQIEVEPGSPEAEAAE